MSAISPPILGLMTGGSSREPHVDFKPTDNSEAEDALRTASTMYQLAMRQTPQEVELSQELLVYPEGEVDAVTITQRDVEGLQPGRFLSDNIIDFYIRFLERGLSPEHGNRFYFFNSFFFTKLLQSTASTGIDPSKVDYEQLRKWSKEVNIFAKDYVFIPILKSSHWSLVIVCHLSNLTRPPGEMMKSPCVVHLDPMKGQHESFEGLIRSYVLQAWMERFQVSSNGDQLLALCQIKYVQAKVPEQDNGHDCGLHVLNYVEAFLVKSTSLDFTFPSSEMGPHFISPHFVWEVLGKRNHIENLIHELCGISQKRAKKRKAIQEVLQSTQNLRSLLFDKGNMKASIKEVQTTTPTFFNGQGYGINHPSTHDDAFNAQDTLMSRGDNEPLDGPQIGPMEHEDRSESLSHKQQLARLEVEICGPTHVKGPIFEAKHASSHEDAINFQHEQSCGMSRLDYELSDVLELRQVKDQSFPQSSSNELQQLELEKAPCMDLSQALKGKNKRGKNMTKEETWVLLSCMVEGGRFCKGNKGATHWNLISEEIGKKLGCLSSANQCRLRYDTLLKAYKTYKKYCMKTGKNFSAITKEERLDLKLATTLSEEWYTMMDEICDKPNISQKRMKLSFNPLSSHDAPASNLPPISQGRSFGDEVAIMDSGSGSFEIALRSVIPASMFNSLNEDLQFTLLNLIQDCSCFYSNDWVLSYKRGFKLKEVCQRLAILQDHEPREILNYVFKLWELASMNVLGMVFEEGKDLLHTGLWKAKFFFLKFGLNKSIFYEVLCKNPHLKTYCKSFPIEESSLQYIRVLRLEACEELEHLDLREFPKLRILAILDCPKINSVTNWEAATSLASLEISVRDADGDFPKVQYFSSLSQIKWSGRGSNLLATPCLNQCVKLQRLNICNDVSLPEIVVLENLKELKFLEQLSLWWCCFSCIRGLSGLHALTTLTLSHCTSLRKVHELGCLKRLNHLDMSFSSIEDVEGVGELHLLTWLDLSHCSSLKWLPFLGYLKALVYLNVLGAGVKEIPGKGDLINLTTLL